MIVNTRTGDFLFVCRFSGTLTAGLVHTLRASLCCTSFFASLWWHIVVVIIVLLLYQRQEKKLGVFLFLESVRKPGSEAEWGQPLG